MKKHGFTLVESLVVASILMVIILFSYVNFQFSELKSRDMRRKNDIKALAGALERYFYDYGEFPLAISGKVVGCGAPGFSDICDWGIGQFGEPEGTIYMDRVPGDPTPEKSNYLYKIDGNKTKFKLFATLENSSDTETRADLKEICPGKKALNTVCNWGYASANTNMQEEF